MNSPTTLRTRPLVAICGSGTGEPDTLAAASEMGSLLARRSAIVVCGGLGGIMTAVAEGVQKAGGVSIGILPGNDPEEANPFIDIPIATGLGHLRNAIITRAAGAVIAFPGGAGTMSEVGFGIKMGKTVIGFRAWKDVAGVVYADDVEQAVNRALRGATGQR